MPLHRLLPLIAASTALATGLAACGSSSDDADTSSTSAAGAPPTATVRIALDYTANVNYLGIYAAIAKGYFAREHIKPVIIPYANTPAEVLIKNHKTDLGISFPPDVLSNRAKGLAYKAVAGVVNDNTTALAVKASSPITRPAQLSGKTYGGFGIPSDEPIIKAIMAADGARDPQYKAVALSTDAYVALAKGRVDYSVVFAGIDDVTAALQGTRLKLFPYARYLGAAGNYPNAVFVAGDDTIASKAGPLRRALAALSQGYAYSVAHPADAERLLIAQNETALGKSAAIVKATGDATVKHFLDPSGRWGPLQDSDFSGLATILVRGGIIKAPAPAPSEVYTNSLLPTG